MDLIVRANGTLEWKGHHYPCALGTGGIHLEKQEGDGRTPVGRFALKSVYYRSDRVEKPDCKLDIKAISADDGWCDDPDHPDYNKPVKLPFSASHEQLYRDDHIYDIIVVLGHNDNPPIPYKGSAIFFHLARDNFEGTQGCVAVREDVMCEILKDVTTDTYMDIRAQ